MAMAVSPEVAKLFQVLTGEEWPDADEDQLRALAAVWADAAQDLGQLAVGLRGAVAAIRANFAGEAERAFAERVAPFIEGDNLVEVAAQLFNDLAKTLLDLALDVEYMKLVIILSLIALIAEMAWAIAMSPFTGGATMAWLAARFAVVRFMIQNLLRRVITQVLQIAVFSIAFQLLIDAAAQTIQYIMGTRHEWNTKHTANAAGVGAMGAALALPVGALGQIVGGGLGKLVTNAFAKSTIKNLTEIGTEALHEMLTEALYKYATEGEFELNPYAATAGAASGGAEVAGSSIGDRLFSDKGGGGGGGGNDRSGPSGNAPNDPVDSTAPGGSSGGSAGGYSGGPNAGPNGGPSGGPSNGPVGGPDSGPTDSGPTGSGPNGVTNGPAGGNQPTDRTVTGPGGTEPGPSANNTTPNTVPPPVTSNAGNGPNPQQPDPQSSETPLPVDGQAVPGGQVPPVTQDSGVQAPQGSPQPVVPGSGLPEGGQVPSFAPDSAGVMSPGDGQAVPVSPGPGGGQVPSVTQDSAGSTLLPGGGQASEGSPQSVVPGSGLPEGGQVPPFAQDSTGQTPLPGDGQVTQPPTADGPGTSHSGNGQAPQQPGQVPPVAPDPETGSTETPSSNGGQASPTTQAPGTNTESAPAPQQTNPPGPGTSFAPPPPVVQQEPATTGTGQLQPVPNQPVSNQPVSNQPVAQQPAALHGTGNPQPASTPPNPQPSGASQPSTTTRLPSATPTSTVPSAQPSHSTGAASSGPGTSGGSPKAALPPTQPSQSAGTTSSSGTAQLPSGKSTGKQGPGSGLDQAPVSLAVGLPALEPVAEPGSTTRGSGPVPDPTASQFGTSAPDSTSSGVQPGVTDTGRTDEPSPGVENADQSHGRPGKTVLDDESWRHFPGKTAEWMTPVDRPLHRDQWEHLRGSDPGTFTHVESELTAVFVQSPFAADAQGRPRLDLRSEIYPVRHDVRRIEVEPGRWVKEFTLKVHLDVQSGVDSARLPRLKRNTVRGVDRMYNQGYRMPDGDQFHVRVEFTDDPAQAYQHVRVWPDRERLTHNDWSIGGNPQDLAHELGHYGFALFDAYEHSELSMQNKPAGAKHMGRDGKVVADVSNRVVPDDDSGLMSLSYRPDTVLRPRELWQIARNLVGSSKIIAETPYVPPHGNGPAPEQSMFARAAAGDIAAISVLADQGHQGALVELTRLAAAGNAQARESLVALAADGELHALDGLARAGDNVGRAEIGGRTAVQVLAELGNQPVPNTLAQALLTNLARDGHVPSLAAMAILGDAAARDEIRRLAANGNLDALSTMVEHTDVPGLVDLTKAGNTDAYQGIKHLASQGNIDAVTALTHEGDVQGLVDAAVQNGPAYEAVKGFAAQGDAIALAKVVAVGDVPTLTDLTLANNVAAYRELKSLAGLGNRDAVQALYDHKDVAGLVEVATQNGPAYEAVKVLAAQGDATALAKVVAVGDVPTLTDLTLANNVAAYRELKSLAGLGNRDAVQALYDHKDVAGLVEVAGTGGLAYEAAKALAAQGFSTPEMTSAPQDAQYPNPPAAPPRTPPPSASTETGPTERSFGPEPEASFTVPPGSTRLGDEQRGTLDALAEVLTNATETRRQDGYLPPPVTVSGAGAQVIVDALADHGIDAKAEPGRADGADVHVDWRLTRANQDPAEQILNDESWRHSTAETAPWFDPKAEHVPPHVIEDAARSQPVVGHVRGEQGGLRTDGSVWRGPIGYDIRRFDVEHVVPGPDGTPVRVTVPVEQHTTKLHLDPGNTGVDVDALRERVRTGVDEMYNHGYRTAGGRQFHVSVEFTDNPAEAHGVVKVGVPRGSMNQLNWSADASARELGHEVGHFQGMHDEYLAPEEPKPVFNHQDGNGHVMPDKGPMTATFADDNATFKPRNMWLIENRMNALESTAGLPDPAAEFPEPPRAPGEDAARAAVDAARRRLDAAEAQLARATGASVPDPRVITAAENRVAAATDALDAANEHLSIWEYHNWLDDAFSDTESLHDTDEALSLAEQPSPPAPHRGIADVLPRKDWYRLYLDPAHFDLAESLFPNDPGSFYDHDESPGFQASMEAAYERFLDPENFPEQRLNADVYEQMHDAVNSSLKKKTHWTAQDYEATEFPLRAENPSPDVLTETLNGRPLLVEGGDYLVGGNAVAFIDRVSSNRPYIVTNYAYEDVRGLVDAVFNQFYDDMAKANTDADRLKAIGRAVRTVHIVHPFNDTNRRLNVHLLLPRLMLEAGFQPVAFKDMDQLFQGGRSLDQIADALARGQGMDLTGRIRGTETDSIASTDETRPGDGRRELAFPPETPPKKKKPVVAWAAAEVITGRHLPPPPVGDPGRATFDDIVDAVALQYDSYGHFHADQLARKLAASPEALAKAESGPWTYRVNRALAVVDALSADGKAAYAAAADEVAEIVKRHHGLPENRNPKMSQFGEIMAVVGLRHLAGGPDSANALSQRLAEELGTGHRPDETADGPGTGSPSPSPAPPAPAPEPRTGTPEPSPEFTADVPSIEVTPAQDVPVIEVTPAQEEFPNPPAAPRRIEPAPPEAIEMGQVSTAATEQPATGQDSTTGQENQQPGHVAERHNPFADRITTATEAVERAAQARDDIASAIGPIKVDIAKAQRHVAAIEQSTRDTQGAVTATEQAFGPNPDRIDQARQNLDDAAADVAAARGNREEARTRLEDAADRLAQARENHSDDGVRRWARIERERTRELGNAENDVTQADIAHRQAVQDLDHAIATTTSMSAARDAHRSATNALETARNAVTTTADAHTRTQAGLNTANTAAVQANTVLADLRDAANRANDADAAFTDLTGRRDTINEQITTLTGTRADLAGQRDAVDAQPVTDENRQELEVQRRDLDNRITELDNRIATLTDQAADLATRAESARNRYDDAARDLDTSLERIDTNVRDARNAAAAANTSREDAKNAVAAAEAAKTVAEDAAKQAKVERGLTMLSFLPHNSELHIETLGNRDQLVDGLANASGLPRRDVANQVGAMSDEQVTNAIDSGSFRLSTPSGGTVDVTVHVDLHRPADTRTAPQHQQPAAIKSESARESSVPKTEATSSTVPIRIPLVFVSPLDLAGTVMRPIAYVGVTGKRAQRFESVTTASESTSSERTAHVPTTLALTLSGPGDTTPVTSSIHAGLRLPDISRVDPVRAPLPANDYGGVHTAPAVVPPAFRDLLGNSPDGATTLGELLLTQNTRPRTVTVDGNDVVITPTGPARITLAGTTSSTTSNGSSHGNSWQTTRGSDATFGFGLYGGPKSWYVGGFADFSTGLTAASTPGVDDSIAQSRTNTELVYQVDRPMQADQGGTNAQDTVSGTVKVTLAQARDLGLPLPPHLSGSAQGPGGQRYVFGRDDITSVDADAVVNFVTGAVTDTPKGLSATGRTAIAGLFSSQDTARHTIFDAMHGGAQAVWTKGGKTHIVDIHAVPVPPERVMPSGQTDISTEATHTNKIGTVTSSARTARAGAGGAFLPVGADSPNPNAPKTTPEAGNPNPYQGGPTAATAAPRSSVAAGVESGITNKSGYSGKDGRGAKYTGEMRDFTGSLNVVVVHRTTPAPNWAQRLFLGDRLLFGPSAGSRLSGPAKSAVEQALTGHNSHKDIHTRVVAGAVTVTTPADKLEWATKPLPPSTMTPGVYLGAAPPNPNPAIDPELFGEYTAIEHVRISPNVTEGVEVALAKRIEPAEGTAAAAGVTRRPPKGSGNWSSWGQNAVIDTRNNPDGSQDVTSYTYKHSDLTRPGTTPGSAVRDFVGRVGSHGTASQGLGGRPNSTGKMLREGRLSDLNGTLTGKAEYSAPRLVEVRPESTLKRNQAGDQVAGSTKSWSVGLDGEVSGGVIPRRDNGTGALITGVVGGGGKYGRSSALELTSGGKQTFEYTGPTAFVAMDVRYRFSADMNLRNVFHRSDFADVPVTVDEPDGLLVEMPVAHAIDMFTQLGLPVPPELSALRPEAKTPVSDPAHTLLTGGGYASYSDTAVLAARLTDSLDDVGDRLTELDVTDKEWRAEVVEQIDLLLNSPAGHVWLRDPLTGEQGHGGLISVPDPGPAFEDVVDIRVRTEPAADVRPRPTIEKLVPGKQSSADYVTVSTLDQEATTWSLSGAVHVGVRHGETPATPPGQPDANGVVQQAPPNAGASSGSFAPQVVGGARTWKTETVLDGSGSTKQTTQVDTDKVGRDTRQVVHTLEITRRRNPMPAVDTVGLGIPKHLDWDKLPSRPVTLRGEIDLVSPSAQVSPPLTRPARAPEFETLAGPPPDHAPLFGADDGWRVESIGADTVNAIHDTAYAQLSSDQPTRPRPSAQDMADSAKVRSEYTRPGSNSEYILHNAVKGTTLHNVSNFVFSGGSHKVGRILGSKHPFYDGLFDYRLTGHLHGNLTFDKALPPDTTMNLSKDDETAIPKGTTKTVSTSAGPSVLSSGANTHNAAGPAPTNVIFGPPASESIGNDKVTATSSKTGTTGGRKYGGRSYLFVVDQADFYSHVERHGSNWTHRPLTAIKDALAGRAHRPDTTVKISSFADMKVRVWENTALDKGLLSIGTVWQHAGKLPAGQPYTVTPNTDGATIHPAGRPAPPQGPPVTGPRGRTLHIAPGVSQSDVTAFIGSLPSDMRPVTVTVAPDNPFTATDIQAAVRDLPEPKATETTGTDPSSARQPGDAGGNPVRPPTDAIGMRPLENAGMPVADPSDVDTRPEPPADRTQEPRPGKRSRDAFEADDGPVTRFEPPDVRPVPERLVEPAPEDTEALLAVVPQGRKFTDPATFAGLINPSRSGAGRDVNCVDAALAFHATYHGAPRVAGSAPSGLRSGASTAAEELGYAPELFSRGAEGLGEVIARVDRAGHGADALVFGFPRDGAGHAWNVVNHNGSVFLVDAQDGTVTPATPDAVPWLDRVYAIPLDADGNYVTEAGPEPTPPTGSDPYETAEYERAVAGHRMRAAAAAGEEIPVPGTNGRLVPSLGGLRLVGAAVTASIAAELAAMSGRDVIALVIGADAVDDEDDSEPVVVPEVLRFPPRGRPEPVAGE